MAGRLCAQVELLGPPFLSLWLSRSQNCTAVNFSIPWMHWHGFEQDLKNFAFSILGNVPPFKIMPRPKIAPWPEIMPRPEILPWPETMPRPEITPRPTMTPCLWALLTPMYTPGLILRCLWYYNCTVQYVTEYARELTQFHIPQFILPFVTSSYQIERPQAQPDYKLCFVLRSFQSLWVMLTMYWCQWD